jgi:hypothetical protein
MIIFLISYFIVGGIMAYLAITREQKFSYFMMRSLSIIREYQGIKASPELKVKNITEEEKKIIYKKIKEQALEKVKKNTKEKEEEFIEKNSFIIPLIGFISLWPMIVFILAVAISIEPFLPRKKY